MFQDNKYDTYFSSFYRNLLMFSKVVFDVLVVLGIDHHHLPRVRKNLPWKELLVDFENVHRESRRNPQNLDV
jgi:hypothetical protein